MEIKRQFSLPFLSLIFLVHVITGICHTLNNINIFNCQSQLDGEEFKIEEATIQDLQWLFALKKLTSRQLVDFYLHQIDTLNPVLRGVIEVNPDAQDQADEADRIRDNNNNGNASSSSSLSDIHGIPVLLKDSINTYDKLNTTAGSYALLGSKVTRDARVVERLRKAGAVILGKSSMTEWYQLRDFSLPNGWSARSGQGLNPYVQGGDPCGSSSGSAISVAANMVAVSLGTETDGSILCPADSNSVVGLKPTVGLTSRAGVIPVSPRQDTIGPICRTVSDAVYVLDAIVGFDPRDREATEEATKFIPVGGYKQFLKKNGLKGKTLGVVKNPFVDLSNRSNADSILESHLLTLRPFQSGETVAMLAEFKLSLTNYLQGLTESPVRSLADIIAFNKNNPDLESFGDFNGQDIFIAADFTNGIGEEERKAIELMEILSRDGFEKLIIENHLDAVVTLGSSAATVLAIGGYPGITVPAGYDNDGMPFGILFAGLKGMEPKLIEIAFAFEQATMIRRSPISRSIEINSKNFL